MTKDNIIKNIAHLAYKLGDMAKCKCENDFQLCETCGTILEIDILVDKSGVNDE